MSAGHFEDFLSKTGDVGSTDVAAILAAQETAHLVATPEQLQNGLVTLGYDGADVLSALDMAMLFTKLSAEVGHDFTKFAAEVGQGETSRESVEASAPRAASLARAPRRGSGRPGARPRAACTRRARARRWRR